MKTILYIGNDLAQKTNYVTSMQILAGLLEQEGYHVVRYSGKVNRIARLFHMLWGIWKNRKQADFILIDTFSTLNFYYAFMSGMLARILGIPYIPILRGGNLPNRLKKAPVLSRLLFGKAFRNVAPSKYLQEIFNKKGFQVEYIPNVLDIGSYPFKKREKFEPKLLYVRAFARLYNPVMAIEVLKRIKEKYPAAQLCMVGPDKDGTLADVKRRTKEYGLEDSVRFTGVLPKKEWHELSRSYDIFINTTNVDNTPVSVMEAMALGLPVVSTNVGGIPFLIENKKDGLLVPPGNPEAMSKAIQFLVENNKEALNLSKNARKKAETFDWKQVRKKWNKLLSS